MPYPISAVHSRRFVAAYADRMRMLFGSSLIGYWPLWEASGATANDISGQANNGTYSNVTLAQAGIGDGRTSAQFVSLSSSYLDVYSAGLASDFSGAEGTMAAWCKLSDVGSWTDGASQSVMMIYASGSNDYVTLRKHSDFNALRWLRVAGADTVTDITLGGLSNMAWMHMAITWSESADEIKAYYNGAQTGTTQTSIGAWSGSPDTCFIGDNTAGFHLYWYGYISHTILLNRAATAPEIAETARASV